MKRRLVIKGYKEGYLRFLTNFVEERRLVIHYIPRRDIITNLLTYF